MIFLVRRTDKAKATSRVSTIIRSALEREHHSLTILRIFEAQINQSLVNLRQKFKDVQGRPDPVTIWPKMVTGYEPEEGDHDDACPVWGPIRNDAGDILGLEVVSHTQSGMPRKMRVQLDWYSPELE